MAMTSHELRAYRLGIAPDLDINQFAKALGYSVGENYRKYESGERSVPFHLAQRIRWAFHHPNLLNVEVN